MRTEYHEALEATHVAVGQLGAIADDAVRCSVKALERRDVELAARVLAGADDFETMRRNIDGGCIELIWKQQPVAGELRQVAGTLHIVADLDRIYGYASDISKAALKLAQVSARPASAEIGKAAEVADAMLAEALQAYREGSVELADAVVARDGQVEQSSRLGIEALEAEIHQNPEFVRAGTALLFALADIERVGDRAQNIAWKVKDIYSR